ncbi:uncharacterized protein KD926_003884 [Aspergillus affinis]|uniref:uncharacterized protein n=1 Tax=Aspergillus affinis TaxID=1070780 RepID=UPI0022FE8EEE|nr:uncharacterized protein KD926_003884 [Aspergillus affinis]KAI9043354.1 hypothetical protein KD926_003884 [Aspergillus affinis]
MQYKALSLLALSAVALAAPSPQQNTELEEMPDYEEYVSSVGAAASKTDPAGFGVPTDLGVPTSVLAVLVTAMPASFVSQLADPSAVSQLDKDWESGKYPAWYSSLPGDVKDYVSSMYAEYSDASTLPTNTASATDSDKSTTAGSGSASATATSTGTSDASSSAAQSSSSKTTGSQTTGSSSASASSSAAETTGSQGATSEGGAPAPTGAMAASFAGAAGILGLAFAL